MKKVWIYIKIVLTAIAGVFILVFFKKESEENIKTIKKEIDNNTKKIDSLKVKSQELENKKTEIKKDITVKKIKISNLKQKRVEVQGEEKTFEDAYNHLKKIANK